MPSRSTLMAIAWTIGIIAIINRVPAVRVPLFGS